MNVGDFTKYVIDNMHRATLVNSLNVSKKLIDGVYDVNEFIKISLEYISNFYQRTKYLQRWQVDYLLLFMIVEKIIILNLTTIRICC
jgi:hypothetical protein